MFAQILNQFTNSPILSATSGFCGFLAWIGSILGLLSPILAFIAAFGGAIISCIGAYKAIKSLMKKTKKPLPQ